MRKICFKGKAQALIEIAVFGAILITVLSFLIRYGMVYNQRQSLDMRAFRKALSESVSSERPGNEATVYLIEDKHIPDAGDIFGVGDVYTAEATASVVWGNTLKTEGYEDKSDLPRIQYGVNEFERAYTTAGYEGGALDDVPKWLGIEDPLFAGSFFVKVPNYDSIKVEMSDLRIYYNEEDEPQGVMVMTESGKKDLITGIWDDDSASLLQIIGIIPDLDNPGCIRFALLNPNEGQINPDYMVLNNDLNNDGIIEEGKDVTAANMQGLLPSRQYVERKDSLKLEDSSTNIKSTTETDAKIIVSHQIEKNIGEGHDVYTYMYNDNEEESWIVQK